MSELRELWQQVTQYDRKYINPRLYAVIEALVKVQPEDMPTDEEYNDARDDRIRFLQDALAEAKVAKTIAIGRTYTLRKERDAWEQTYGQAQEKFAEAQAEIETLRPLAENWQLVLAMEDGTALQHTGKQYYAMRCCPRIGFRAIASSCATDPAEALRSIQASE